MPECTKAEREYLDIKFSPNPLSRAPDLLDAASAVRAERRAAAEQGSVTPTNSPPPPPMPPCPVVCERSDLHRFLRDAEARIASLEAALAEERAKPKGGDVRFLAGGSISSRGAWDVDEHSCGYTFITTRARYTGPDAERHAREHAARLQAEHEKGGAV